MRITEKENDLHFLDYIQKDLSKIEGDHLDRRSIGCIRGTFIQAYGGQIIWDEQDSNSIFTLWEVRVSYILLIVDLIEILRDWFLKPNELVVGHYVRASFCNIEDSMVFIKDSDLVYVTVFFQDRYLFDTYEIQKNEKEVYTIYIYDFNKMPYRGHKKTLNKIIENQERLRKKSSNPNIVTYHTHSHKDFFLKALKGYEDNIIDIEEGSYVYNLAYMKLIRDTHQKLREYAKERGWG